MGYDYCNGDTYKHGNNNLLWRFDKDSIADQSAISLIIQYGIPADEIAFIHDAKTDAQRDALFKEMRTGKKKVLIGSTDKCGTGVNVQTHLVIYMWHFIINDTRNCVII